MVWRQGDDHDQTLHASDGFRQSSLIRSPTRRSPNQRPSRSGIYARIRLHSRDGFSLSEALITVVIISILSAIAIPSYINSLNKGRQSDAATVVSQIQSGIQAHADEFLAGPGSWSELSRVTSVMTSSGPASGGGFAAIQTQGGDYSITVTNSGSSFLIQATTARGGPNWNIAACVNTASGASQLTRGSGSAPAVTPVCS